MIRATSMACLAATALLLLPMSAPARAQSAATIEARNTGTVRAAFAAWRAGSGTVFDLLDANVEWQVAGNSPVSGRYSGREAFLAEAVQPITARLSTPISPDVKHVIAQGDAVVVIWDGVATAQDGSPYRNSYAWHMQLRDDRIVRVIAFLDTWTLDQLMQD